MVKKFAINKRCVLGNRQRDIRKNVKIDVRIEKLLLI